MPHPTDPLPSNCHPKLRRLYDYWRAIRPADRVLPGRQHFDPASVPDLLPWIWLLDVQHTPLRFKYRLIGSEQVAAIGSNPVGRWLDEMHAEFLTHRGYPDYVSVAETAVPSFWSGLPSFHTDKRYVSLQRLLLPLAGDGVRVDVMLAITVYMRIEDAVRFA